VKTTLISAANTTAEIILLNVLRKKAAFKIYEQKFSDERKTSSTIPIYLESFLTTEKSGHFEN
jgi:hypothetical protein